MELPNIGSHCNEPTCNRLDFLPVKCDACRNSFCKDHMTYSQHNCPKAQSKDIQVPVCPLCNAPVPSPRNQPPDLTVGEHIDRDCQSDPAQKQRQKNKNKCKAEGCRVKEIIPIVCSECGKNFCLRHRFPQDHRCEGKRGRAADAAQKRLASQPASCSFVSKIQGSMSEDEALAKALSESMKDNSRMRTAGGASNQRCHVS